jgi:uncharacterized protein YpuA (DUF1002 family)
MSDKARTASVLNDFKNSLIIHEENTKKNHKRVRVDRYCKYRIPIYRHQNTGIFNVFFSSQTELLNVEINQVLTKY